jgi:S-adenosylmethionine hydrolase
MPTRRDTVSFVSDYGHADEFAGVVRGVIRMIAPHASVIDVCHDIPVHDVRAGGLLLARAIQYLPPGVVLAVVDPGVGTERRAIAVEAGGDELSQVFVGPDNGLLAAAVAMSGGAVRAVELTDDTYHLPTPGRTFAGRDIFGPVAAHLCNGVDIADLGKAIDPVSILPGLMPLAQTTEEGVLLAEVLWVDRFGNAQLNVDPDEVAGFGDRISLRYRDEMTVVRRADDYAEIRPGEVGLVVDSYGMLALALDRQSAAQTLRLRPGDQLTLEQPR